MKLVLHTVVMRPLKQLWLIYSRPLLNWTRQRGYLVGGINNIPFNIPFRIPAKTDIEVRFLTNVNAGVTSGGATFELWYENE